MLLGVLVHACAYRVVAGPLKPLATGNQGGEVQDDGTVIYRLDRLEVSLKPMSDEELNRQFPQTTGPGRKSLNPYTYGDWKPDGASQVPPRFSVFLLEVENYEFPKVLLNPLQMRIESQNGRTYRPLSFQMLREYYYPYNTAYAGNASARFESRTDRLKSTMYPVEEYIFSGNSRSGYVVFPPLHDDVRQIEVYLGPILLRFDYKNEPIETKNLVFNYRRQVQRLQ